MKKPTIKTISMIVMSIILGRIYLPLMTETALGRYYKNFEPQGFDTFWDMFPLIVIISVIALIIGKRWREFIRLFLIGNFITITTCFLYLLLTLDFSRMD